LTHCLNHLRYLRTGQGLAIDLHGIGFERAGAEEYLELHIKRHDILALADGPGHFDQGIAGFVGANGFPNRLVDDRRNNWSTVEFLQTVNFDVLMKFMYLSWA
jgi:hypothetical protein